MASLFEVNENGEVVYNVPEPTPEPTPQPTPEPTPVVNLEGDSTDVGNDITEGSDLGDVLLSPENIQEGSSQVSETSSSVGIPLTDYGFVPVALSDEVTAAILADSPASGSIGSTTLEYFDRIVSGLPQDYKYVAYRTNTDDSYDAILYYGRKFDIDGNVITFGKDTKEVIVDRVSTSGYNNITNYYSADASHVSVEFEQNGSVIYYTNAVPGFPVLGGYNQSLSYTPFLVAALVGAFVTVVFNKLMKG